ncbi:hypothetical protein FBUS_07346 [Fasciolopsis buskii]|uniref:Uncharacterized protein n=1 Tax=Fasciolopsis buskii TaxID=27845 RepID=A0A8E0VFX8_9TREM|nr:hypothetical protein FBUS_07346 [Fasciolopsis buski]
MRRGWDEEQQLLIAERDEAKSRAVALQSRMEEMDASFRKQLSVTIEANDRAISAARSDAEMIRSCCENRVAEVEAEMRAVLEETEEARVAMEARLRKISTVLYDQPSSDCIPFPTRLVSHGFYSRTCPRVDEWNTSPPPLSVVRTTVSSAPSSTAWLGPSPPSSVVPPTHFSSRGAHPNNPTEREVEPSCEPSASRSPHD